MMCLKKGCRGHVLYSESVNPIGGRHGKAAGFFEQY